MAKKGKPTRHVSYTAEQQETLRRYEADLLDQMASKPKRFAHSCSVAKEAERFAVLYGADPYTARVAGLFHDWDKPLPREEQIARARARGVDLGAPLEDVAPLLHGIIGAYDLHDRYPELPDEVLHAISCHTTGTADPSTLDMIVFVADGIEPLRRSTPDIERLRAMVGKEPLEEVYYQSFTGGLVYVLQGGRYLYPGALDIYNELARRRRERKG